MFYSESPSVALCPTRILGRPKPSSNEMAQTSMCAVPAVHRPRLTVLLPVDKGHSFLSRETYLEQGESNNRRRHSLS